MTKQISFSSENRNEVASMIDRAVKDVVKTVYDPYIKDMVREMVMMQLHEVIGSNLMRNRLQDVIEERMRAWQPWIMDRIEERLAIRISHSHEWRDPIHISGTKYLRVCDKCPAHEFYLK